MSSNKKVASFDISNKLILIINGREASNLRQNHIDHRFHCLKLSEINDETNNQTDF